MQSFLNLRNTLLFVGLLTVWRLYLSATLQLHPDEAYYWLWSRHLDMGYFDHSPIVAYFIWLTTLFSKSELWVRLPGTLVIITASWLTWQLAMRMFNSTSIAAGSVMLFNATPLSMLGLIVITPDIPVYLFWALSVYLMWLIIQQQQAWQWYALGLAFGLALLSKYTALLLLPSLLAYLLLTDDRHWLQTRHPWLAMMLGFFCFMPVIIWNSRHGWISFVFQFHHGLDSDSYAFGRVGEFFSSQLLLVGPLVWLAGMYAAFKTLKSGDKPMLMLAAASLPVILIFGGISIIKLAGPNWTAFAYFSLLILFTRYFLGSTIPAMRYLWYVSLFSTLLLSLLITLHTRFSILPLAKFSPAMAVTDATNAFYGWRELGRDLEQIPGQKIAIAPSHQLGAEIIYYTDEKLQVRTDAGARASQFNIWNQTAKPPVAHGIYVWSNDDSPPQNASDLPAYAHLQTLTILRKQVAVKQFHIMPDTVQHAPTTQAKRRLTL